MKLSQMFKNAPEIEIAGLCIDSHCTKVNDIYFYMEGMVCDGYELIGDAVEEDVECIMHSKAVGDMKKGVVYIQVGNANRTLNQVVPMLYRRPSHKMKVFGAAGASGKSTITSIIRDVYSHFAPCDYIGTISISYGEVTLPPFSTTPNVVLIYKAMKDMVEYDMQAVALEVGSHGLELGRVQSVDFNVAVPSNLIYDHLDFYGTIEHYLEAKRKLFTNLKKEGAAVLNTDDAYIDQLANVTETSVATHNIDNHAIYQAENTRIERTGSRFTLVHGIERYEVSTNLVTLYNIYNPLSAVATMVESGTPIEQQLPYLHDIRQIEGHMEHIDKGQLFNVIADFAHTPDGMEKVFEYAKDITEGGYSIIAVFGSAGERDTEKRKVFGEIASHYRDDIIPTGDDPRDEDPQEIANKVKSGISDTNNIFAADRYAVMWQAIESASVKDTVLILSKGDEVSMCREFGREPQMGDHNVARHYIHKYSLGLEDDERQGYKISIKKFSV